MRPGGQPDTIQEAFAITQEAAAINFNLRRPAHYPESQIIALSQLVQDLNARVAALELNARVAALEAKPKRGRPPKNQAAKANVDLVRTEMNAR